MSLCQGMLANFVDWLKWRVNGVCFVRWLTGWKYRLECEWAIEMVCREAEWTVATGGGGVCRRETGGERDLVWGQWVNEVKLVCE